jgi:hypothetical protein
LTVFQVAPALEKPLLQLLTRIQESIESWMDIGVKTS